MYYFIWSSEQSCAMGVVVIAHFIGGKCTLRSTKATVSRAHALTLPSLPASKQFLLISHGAPFLRWYQCPRHPVMMGSLALSCWEVLPMYQSFPAHLFLPFLYPRKKINFLFTLWPSPETSRKQRACLTSAGSDLPSPPACSLLISWGSPLNPKWDEL